MTEDYYTRLKVKRDATRDEIKRAYRRLAREMHPDVNPDPETQERFKEVTQAYEVLSDTEKRRMYDMGQGYIQGSDGSPPADANPIPDISLADINRFIASCGSAQNALHTALFDEGALTGFLRDALPGFAEKKEDRDNAKAFLLFKLTRLGTIPDERTLNQAVLNENVNLTKFLIEAGGKPTAEMLHTATVLRSWQVAQALMDDGAIPALKTRWYVKVHRMNSWKKFFKQARVIRKLRKTQPVF